MLEIDKRPGMTLAELARVGELSKARTSELVERLRIEGYAQKRVDPANRRAVRLFATDKMAGAWRWWNGRYMAAVNDVMDAVSAEEQEQLTDTQRKVRTAAEEQPW
jgi:DNA-binding MarR family transcriptional regulator